MSRPPEEQPFTDSAVRDLGLTPDVSTPRRRRALVGLGALLVVGGLFVPVFLGQHGGPAGLVATIGLLAGIVGLAYCYGRYARRPRFRSFPPVEARTTVERAGADFELAVATARSLRTGEAITGREAAVDRLWRLAVATVARREGGEPESAEAAVRAGTWTDDEVAASLLSNSAGSREASGSRLPFLGGAPDFERRVERAVGALADVSGWTPAWGSDAAPATTGEGWTAGLAGTGRWRGLVGVGLVAVGVASITRTAGPALAAALALGMAGYARLLDPPEPALSVQRTVHAEDPKPGETVTVSVAVENVGATALADLRVADDVPDGLAVVAGSPRFATSLRPGSRATFSYDVRAVAGEHDFEGLYAVVRDPSGERERATHLATAPATLACEPAAVRESVPLHPRTSGLTGRVPTDAGGSGTEFHSVRAYRPGDPLRRIDWKRMARTGELATLEFREEHAATVVVLIDAREPAFRAPTADALSAVDRSREGALRAVETLLADGDRVGLASVGPAWTWIAPAGGREHRTELRAALGRDPAFATPDPDAGFHEHRFLRLLRYRLPADSQLLCFSPLLDDEIARILRRLAAHGYPLTVFSPDPTTFETVGGTVARLEREGIVADVSAAGVRVVDWADDEPLEVAVARARRGWRR